MIIFCKTLNKKYCVHACAKTKKRPRSTTHKANALQCASIVSTPCCQVCQRKTTALFPKAEIENMYYLFVWKTQ